MNKLSQFLIKFRRKNNQSQTELAKQLLNSSDRQHMISRIEKGEFSLSSRSGFFDEFIKKLSAQSGIGSATLIAWSKDSGKLTQDEIDNSESPQKVKIASGHAIWATPVLLGILCNESIRNTIQISSGLLRDEETLNFFDPDKLNLTRPSNDNPTFDELDGNEAINQLRKGEVDLAIVAGELLEQRPDLISLVTIASQCTYYLVLENDKAIKELTKDSTVSSKTLAGYLKKQSEKHKPKTPIIACAANTAAQRIALDAWSEALPKEGLFATVERIANIPSNEQLEGILSYKNIKNFTEKDEQKVLCGIITWEPIASWLNSSNAKKPIEPTINADGRINNITFEIVALRSQIQDDQFFRQRIEHTMSILLPELLNISDTLKKIDRDYMENRNTKYNTIQALTKLAPYFSMSESNATTDSTPSREPIEPFQQSIAATDFSLSVSPEYWLLSQKND